MQFIDDKKYLNLSESDILKALHTKTSGLTVAEYETRLEKYGHNDPVDKIKKPFIFRLLVKFVNPLAITLIVIAAFSYIFAEKISAFFVLGMALMSVIIEFIQEEKANSEAEKLTEMVRVKTTVLRDHKEHHINMVNIVPGDIVQLRAGDLVPADLRIIQANDLFINQSTFTGESFPVEKKSAAINLDKPGLGDCCNLAFMGSSVVSGTGLAVVIRTGKETEFGKLSHEINKAEEETTFDRGIKDFTMMMLRILLILGLVVFLINYVAKGNPVEAILFALAVAVGMTPDMLPMVVALNLSKGARAMAEKDVIVKKLKAMQNFGAMDTLCTDKTGTLTLDKVALMKHSDPLGREDEDVLRYAYINSFYQTGLNNLLDHAVLEHEHLLIKEYKKVYEIPFDFERRLVSVIVKHNDEKLLIAKGAPEEIFSRSNRYFAEGDIRPIDFDMRQRLQQEYDDLSHDGFRVLAVAYREYMPDEKKYSKEDEFELIFKGYVAFLDPPKPDVEETIQKLEEFGINLKILSGDNEFVVEKVCQEVKLNILGMITGKDLDRLDDAELRAKVGDITVFSRLDPVQKERVIHALRATGHTVGFLGDGINDAPALKAADVGISVNNAAGVAKDTADIILLKKSLSVLADCVIEGRKSFANILKYLKMGASSNYGNMFSMTGASLLLPFLPMLPVQILFNNFLYDASQITLPNDDVDIEEIKQPKKWDIGFIKKYILYMGPVSSIFDFLTFAVMWFIFHANSVATQSLFHTGWFVESLCTQTLVIYIIRTNKIPFKQSWPNKLLIFTTVIMLTIGFVFANTSIGKSFGFTALPTLYFFLLAAMILVYLFMVQKVKVWFMHKFSPTQA